MASEAYGEHQAILRSAPAISSHQIVSMRNYERPLINLLFKDDIRQIWHKTNPFCALCQTRGDSENASVAHCLNGPEEITRIYAKKDLGIQLSSNMSFSLHHEKSAQNAFAVLWMIRRTFYRITRMDFQILNGAYVSPLLNMQTKLSTQDARKTQLLQGVTSLRWLSMFHLIPTSKHYWTFFMRSLALTGLLPRASLKSSDTPLFRLSLSGYRQPLNGKNETNSENLGENLDRMCQSLNPCNPSLLIALLQGHHCDLGRTRGYLKSAQVASWGNLQATYLFSMIYLTIVAVFCLLDCSANQFDIPRPPKEQYFTQRVDHMNFQPANITYRMRYLYEDKWYKSGGPIFFYCGNEGDIFGFWNNSGFIFHLASKMDAMVVFAEHRYYGKSLPFKNSFSQPYIQFLSIEQTLADYANLIQHLKEKYGRDNTAVIAFGGSYGGMLAAYMRASYPHLVAGAIASSAPVNWVAGLGNIHQFFEHVTDDYNQVNPQCVARVKNAYDLLERMVMEDIRALASISKQMKLCKPMHTIFDFVWMLKWSRNAFVMMTMLDYPTDNTFISQLPAYPVNVSCAKILAAPDVISALRDAVSVWYNSSK
ncbi:dipeptidyl peptidase 2, partial [Clonorchis sinensis]